MAEQPANAVTSAKLDTIINMFPDAMARIVRLEGVVANLMNVNLQLAERVARLERQAAALA